MQGNSGEYSMSIYQPLTTNRYNRDDLQHEYDKIGQNQMKEEYKLKNQLSKRSVMICLIMLVIFSAVLLITSLGAISLAFISLNQNSDYNSKNYRLSEKFLLLQSNVRSLIEQVSYLNNNVSSLHQKFSNIENREITKLKNTIISVNDTLDEAKGDIMVAHNAISMINSHLSTSQNLYQNCHQYTASCDIAVPETTTNYYCNTQPPLRINITVSYIVHYSGASLSYSGPLWAKFYNNIAGVMQEM